MHNEAPAVLRRAPRASHTTLVLSGGNRWSAAGYNLLFQPDSFMTNKIKENAEGDITVVPWSLTLGTTEDRIGLKSCKDIWI